MDSLKNCLEDKVQLEFPFTKKGYMQERAILQDIFLRDVYEILKQEDLEDDLPVYPFEYFEQKDGFYWMKEYAKKNPMDYEYLNNLI